MNRWNVFGLEGTDRATKGFFFGTITALAALVCVGLLYPAALETTLNSAFDWVLYRFGWWFMALGVALVAFTFFMAFSRYGRIRIGGEDAEPEFGVFSWIAMVFTVGFGSSIVVWGVGEPISIVTQPPPTSPVPGASIESLALAFMFLHESFPGMAMWYLPFALGFGLMAYTTESDDYRISSMMSVVLDRERYGWLFWLVDLAALIAIVGGLATTLGFTAQQLATILSDVFGAETNLVTYGLFALIGLVFLGDVWLGLHKGIRNAARVTFVLMLVTSGVLLAVGPTLFILNITLDATGIWLNNLPRLALYTAPTSGAQWPQSWTSFWWAWWAAWGLFVGSFVARVSKGRTIRETFVALVAAPTLLTWLQHGIIGGWVLAPGYVGPVSEAFAQNDIPTAVATAITLTPFGTVIGVLLVLIMAGYVLTTLDSAVYMLSAITLGEEEPNARNRAWWGALLTVLGVMTLNLPAFSAMEAFSPVMALPFTLFFVVLMYTTYVTARRYYREEYKEPGERPYFAITRASEESGDDGT
ncbi:L-carnitine/gamma-butyrobetaine antiporter [Halalkalicoccus paucihalophilus]|uniref:L-carnitine/gamma-butyrobetaine antiporter n=1 Tax=Halalkalicoccus paucihalophilus TaxID=1008153 RepID=A0A151AHS2_9EURY|nr:BCCT family transporter [Halalkalicoccus paucihalophilus]KYH27209.1 L-carnitine/gamma-butyrobetaine antiporter [Halalkalicoccus paucihalophilus]